MIADGLGRQVAALIVALGVFLSGAGSAWSAPASGANSMPAMAMAMLDMAMDKSCMEVGKAAPDKQTPAKSSDSSCGVCISCATNIALVENNARIAARIAVALLHQG